MEMLLKFIKDWFPSIGVIIAALWVLFKWLYEEKIRREKEMPAIDGKMSANIISLGNNKNWVTIESLWNNKSPLPLYLDIHKCCIDIFKIDSDALKINHSIILKADLGKPVCSSVFLLKMVEIDYYLEPNTQSTIINHFVLENGIYGVRMMLHSNEVGGMWWKEMIINTEQPASATTEK